MLFQAKANKLKRLETWAFRSIRVKVFLRLLMAISLGALSLSVSADQWMPQTDLRYSEQNPDLFEKVEEARKLIDGYRGRTEQLVKSQELLEYVLNEDDRFVPAYRQAARLVIRAGSINSEMYREGALEQAEKLLRTSLQIEPDYAESYVQLANILHDQGDYAGMLDSLERAEAIGTEDPWLKFFWAQHDQAVGERDKALVKFQAMVDDPLSDTRVVSSSLVQMIKIYKQLGRNDQVNSMYLKQIELDPDSAWHWGNYSSFLLYRMHDVDNAILAGEKALSLMNYPRGRLTTASALYTKWAYAKRNGERGAQKYYDKAYKLFPDTATVIAETRDNEFTLPAAQELWMQNDSWLSKEKWISILKKLGLI